MQNWWREDRFVSRVAFHLVVLFAIYFGWQIGYRMLAWNFKVRLEDLPTVDNLAIAITMASYVAMVVVLRVLRWHPAFNEAYRKWLKTTPWDASIELPMSNVMIRWSDLVAVLVAMLISSFSSSIIPWGIPILVGTAHLLMMVGVFRITGSTRDCYLVWFGSALVVLLIPHWMWLVPLLAIAEIFKRRAHHRCLTAFPWDDVVAMRVEEKPPKSKSVLGFHYESLRTDVAVDKDSQTDSAIIAFLISLTCLAVMRVVSLPGFNQDDVQGGMLIAAGAPAIFFALRRVWQFKIDYRSPLSLWGRLGTGRVLIPQHDRVYVVPFTLICIGLFNIVAVIAFPIPALWLAIGLGLVVWVYRTGKPSLEEWRLTGPIRLGAYSYEQRQNLASR